jgi:hypothetical protein
MSEKRTFEVRTNHFACFIKLDSDPQLNSGQKGPILTIKNNKKWCQSDHGGRASSIKLHFSRNSVSFRSVPSFGIGSSAELGMPRNGHFLPRNNGNHSESIPRNFFGTKFRSQP